MSNERKRLWIWWRCCLLLRNNNEATIAYYSFISPLTCVRGSCYIIYYTLKNKGASKGSSSDAIEEPLLVPQRTIQSKPSLSYLFIIWRTFFHHKEPFVNQKGSSDVKRFFIEAFRQKGSSMASWSTFICKSIVYKCTYPRAYKHYFILPICKIL